MPLPKQSLPMNFARGLDTKTDPLQVSPGNFLSLQNSVFTTGGRITKRNGYTAFGTSVASTSPVTYSYSTIPANISTGRLVAGFNNELLLNDATNLYSYDGNANGWVYKGRSTMVSLATEQVAAGGSIDARYMDCAYDSTTGIKTYAWLDSTSSALQYSIQDANTGQFLFNKVTFTITGDRPHVVAISGKTFIFYYDNVATQIYALTITGRVPGSAAAVITNNDTTTPNFDVDVVNGSLYIAYNGAASTTKVALLNSSLAVTASISKAEVASNGVNLFGDTSNNIWVVYNNAAATKAFIVDSTVVTTVLAPTTVDAGATAANVINVTGCYSSTQTKAFIFYDRSTTSTINFNTLTVGGTAGTAVMFMKSANLSSKAWAVSGVPNLVAVHDSTLQPTYFLLNLYNYDTVNMQVPANIAAKISPDASGIKPALSWIARSNLISGSNYLVALGLKTLVSSTVSSVGALTNLYTSTAVIGASFDFSLSNPSALVLGNNLFIATGELIMYDGSNVVEHGFHIWPEGTTTANGVGNLAAGTYGYKITYEWIDNQGQIHRSAPSPVVQFVAGGANGCTLTLPTLMNSNKQGVSINIYRTAVNGSVYYKVSSSFQVKANDPTVATVTYTDNLADTALISNTPLYTAQEIENIAAPSPKFLGTYKNRVILVPAEMGTAFWYSKQVVNGSPVEFSDSFIQNVGTIGGNLTAVSPLDDKLILGKSASVYYLVGTGPSPSGENNDFTDPQLIATDCGPSNFGSLTTVPTGLMFQSAKGIYLLDRSLGVQFIGAPAASFNSQTIYSGNLIPTTTQVRFALSGGSMLMYDYFYGQWGTFTGLAAVSSIIFAGYQTFVTSSGQVYKENPASYVDGATVIPIYFKTGWFNMAGLQGFERAYYFYFLAQYISSHTLSINLYYDYDASTIGQTISITPNSADLEQWRVFLTKQKCEAFQIELTESAGSGAGFTMSGIDLIYSGKKPYPTLKAAASAG